MPKVTAAVTQRRAAAQKARALKRSPLGDKTNTPVHTVETPGSYSLSTRETRSTAETIKVYIEGLQAMKRALTKAEEIQVHETERNICLQETVADLENDINMLESKLSVANNRLTSVTQSLSQINTRLQTAHNRAKHYSTALYSARKSVRREKAVIANLRMKNSVLRAEYVQQKKTLTEQQHELLAMQNKADCDLRLLAEAHFRAAQYMNQLHDANNERLILLNRISTLTHQITQLNLTISDLQKRNSRRTARLTRASARIWDQRTISSSLQRFLTLTESRVYNPYIRSLVLRLVGLGCPVMNVGKAVDAFVQCISRAVGGQQPRKKKRLISARTVSRIVSEADIAGKVQLGYELQATPSFTSGGDGTTNKNQQFESINFNLLAPTSYRAEDNTTPHEDERKVRFVKVELAANHRSETQKKETVAAIQEAIGIFSRSPLADTDSLFGHTFDEVNVVEKYVGSHGDHAEDQKAKHWLLGEWKQELMMRGLSAKYLQSKNQDEKTAFLAAARRIMIENTGGAAAWEALPECNRAAKEDELLLGLCESLAEEAYAQLSDDEKRRLKLWVWAGCGMHKDLNSVKGGDSAMQIKWTELGISPILLANKDNAAVLEACNEQGLADDDDEGRHEKSTMEKRARDATKAGGVKLMSLMGALLNHKDDKKGQQHTFRDYAQFTWGRTFTFPDTSNTRYSSYLEAAAEVMAHSSHYLEYMQYLRDFKGKRTLNNLEANVVKGLQDGPTCTELAVLALYQEAVSHSYIATIRGPGLEKVNALALAPLHEKVHTHIKKLIDDPEIILSPSADPRQATMNGYETWKNEGAVKVIHGLTGDLPHLKDLFKAFMSGALKTWERFSAEFADDGTIAALTEAERNLAWIPATNNANEGALGAYRVFARKNPTGTLRLFNAIFRMKRNDTHEFMEAMLSGPEHAAFLRKEAKVQEALGIEKKRRREIFEENVESVMRKRVKDDQRREKEEERRKQLEEISIQVDPAMVERMTGKQLKDQLDKLRILDPQIPLDWKMKNKGERLAELKKALPRYEATLKEAMEVDDINYTRARHEQ